MANPLENMLLLQYLSGAGQDIGSGNAIGTNVNAITQQNIQSRNFMKLLQKMLSGQGVPEGGKMTMDSKGTKIEVPSSAGNPLAGSVGLTQGSQDPMAQGKPLSGASPQASQAPLYNPNMSNFLNPSASPLGISGADLAGLTPDNISQALQFKFGQEAFQQKKLTDAADLIYKSALTQRALTPAPAKDDRTTAVKNYEFYANQQKSLGKTPKSFEAWDKDTRTGHEKDYDRYRAEGGELDFHSWLRDITALSGGIDLDEYRKRKEITADVDAEKYFTDPKGLAQDVDKYVNSEEVQNKLFQLSDDPTKRNRQTILEKDKFITSKITSAGGKITGTEMDGRVRVYKVKWPNGKTGEVRYEF